MIACMFTDDCDNWDVAVGALILTLVLAGLYAMHAVRSEATARNRPSNVELAPQTSLPEVAVDEVDVQPEHGTSFTEPAAIAVVYECVTDGHRILSDRPCGPAAEIRRVTAPNRMDAQDTRNLYRSNRGASGSYRRSSTRDKLDSAECVSIEERIDAINARMRRGYTGQQGEWYRERLRELSEARHEAKCIR